MTYSNRRRADRVSVGILAQLDSPRGLVTAQVVDLSRAGLRLRAVREELGLAEETGADAATEQVREALRKRFLLSLNHERLGSLLQRRVEIVRVQLPPEEHETCDICCSFLEPLDPAEVSLLESHLPPLNQVVKAPPDSPQPPGPGRGEPASAPTGAGIHAYRPARREFQAFVSTSRDGSVQTFRCRTDLVTGVGVRVALPRRDYGDDTPAAARTFVDRYGRHLDLRLSDEDYDVWSGRVRVSGVELPTREPELMLVTFAFDRSLALNEMRSLGLVDRVA